MIERATLIICSNKSVHGNLPGALLDAKAWTNYLQSNSGGVWNADEITFLRGPSQEELEIELNVMAFAEIGFVAFSGHGYYDSYDDETYICLNDHENVNVRSLYCGPKKW